MSNGGGNFSLVIFLLLSSYGITKSEIKHPLDLKEYSMHRFLKLLKPYAIIMAIFIAVYWMLGANATPDEMATARLSPAFIDLGQHQVTWHEILGYFFGVFSINGSMWFVGVTLFSYFAFFISKSIFKINEHRLSHIILYSALLAVFGCVTYQLDFPAHYWRNLWALVLGLVLALYEKELLDMTLAKKFAALLLTDVLVFLYVRLTHSGSLVYLAFANIGFLAIALSNKVFAARSLKKGSYVAWLAALSYEIYLIHGYVLPIEWWTTEYISATLTIIVCVLLAQTYSITTKSIRR